MPKKDGDDSDHIDHIKIPQANIIPSNEYNNMMDNHNNILAYDHIPMAIATHEPMENRANMTHTQ